MHPRPATSLPAPLRRLLRATSRSFYLTLQVLPCVVRPQIGLAYLLARTADTITDTEVLPAEDRLGALREFRDWVLGLRHESLDFETVRRHLGATPEGELLRRSGDALAVLNRFSREDQQRIRWVLEIIISGQDLDLRRFATSPRTGETSPASIRCLQTEAELDDYTYRVAGCVGEFWTRLSRAHVFPAAPLDEEWLVARGIRFGQGLQLVNILRDLPVDLRKGRCYLPASALARVALQPADLLDPGAEPRLRPVYQELLDRAQSHLAAGWAYTCALPRRAVRVRLACAWPILIGRETLLQLRRANVLDPQQRIKVPRAGVRRILVRTVMRGPFPRAWEKLWPEAGPKAEP